MPDQNLKMDVREALLLLAGSAFGCIYADPPWDYGNKATRGAFRGGPRGVMTVDELSALPVVDVLADQAHLHLWTTKDFVFDAKEILEAWGFGYSSMLVWIKPQTGLGNYWRVSHEILLLGTRGPKTWGNKTLKSWFMHDRISIPHSRKPDTVRALIESVSPAPRLELFSTQESEGWTSVGLELGLKVDSQCEVVVS